MTIVLVGLVACVAATVINLLMIVLVWRHEHRLARWAVGGLALGLAGLMWTVPPVLRQWP